MRYLGLDVGDKTIGVALSDETETLATGLETIKRVGPRKDLQAVGRLVREREAGTVVVGLPRTLEGTIGPQAEKVLAFVEAVKPFARVPVVTWDERFTTSLAHQAMIEGHVSRQDRRERADKVAAVLILQSYLDSRKLAAAERPEPPA